MITKKQKELLQHTLGADSRYKKKDWGFRNRFCAGDEGDKDRTELEKLEEIGLVKSGVERGNKMYWATKKGAIEIGFKPYQLRNADLAL